MLLKKICWTNVAQEKSMVCIPEPGETNSLSLGLVKIEMTKYVSLFLFLELCARQERIDVLCTLVLPHILAFEPLVDRQCKCQKLKWYAQANTYHAFNGIPAITNFDTIGTWHRLVSSPRPVQV